MYYRMHDSRPAGMIPTRKQDLAEFNRQGFGVFHTVNVFDGARRIENLVQIRAWAVDIDEGSKDEQRQRILSAPVIPSTVVESKGGHHVYWRAIDARPEHYATIVSRLVQCLRGDRNARDLARVLRTPGYYHLKDPGSPYLVQAVYRGPGAYTERQMAARFPPSDDELRVVERKTYRPTTLTPAGDDFWERVYNLDCREGLLRLSGHPAVSGDEFELKPQRNGNTNIVVNGKGTSCFVDHNGRIGSGDRGGPTIAQWIRWYGRSYAEAAKVIKELFPEVAA